MGNQIYSIEFLISFLTIYNNIVCTDGKVPAKIILLYGGISSYTVHSKKKKKKYRGQLIITKGQLPNLVLENGTVKVCFSIFPSP